MFGREGPCAIVRGQCPKNADPEKGRYCPHWCILAETNDATGEVRHRASCDITVTREWLSSIQKAGWVSGKFLTKAANGVIKAETANAAEVIGLRDEINRIKGQLMLEDHSSD